MSCSGEKWFSQIQFRSNDFDKQNFTQMISSIKVLLNLFFKKKIHLYDFHRRNFHSISKDFLKKKFTHKILTSRNSFKLFFKQKLIKVNFWNKNSLKRFRHTKNHSMILTRQTWRKWFSRTKFDSNDFHEVNFTPMILSNKISLQWFSHKKFQSNEFHKRNFNRMPFVIGMIDYQIIFTNKFRSNNFYSNKTSLEWFWLTKIYSNFF